MKNNRNTFQVTALRKKDPIENEREYKNDSKETNEPKGPIKDFIHKDKGVSFNDRNPNKRNLLGFQVFNSSLYQLFSKSKGTLTDLCTSTECAASKLCTTL